MITLASNVFAQPKDQARCFTTWDDNFLYLSFRVDCPDVESVHNIPNAPVTGDDAIEIYVETDNKHNPRITESCLSMAVSAGGGAQFSVGTSAGQLQLQKVFTFKYGAFVQGTLNNNDDIDTGYTVEMALPWSLMKKSAPAVGDMMSFNIVVRRHGDKPGDFVSLSPHVKSAEDALSPAKWINVVLAAYSFVAMTPGSDKIVSARSIVNAPLINGNVDDREWPKNCAFNIDLPAPIGFTYAAKFPVQRMVFATYHFGYQRDARKLAEYTKLAASDGGIQIDDYPSRNIGPWFSDDRVQWHKEQLSDMVAAGIDVTLPVFKGGWNDSKALDCFVSAADELSVEGKPCPKIAMMLDPTVLSEAYGKLPSFKDEEVKKSLYGLIKSFYDRVPSEQWAFAQSGKPKPGRLGAIVFVAPQAGDLDAESINYCSERFEADFGCPIICVGPSIDNGARISTGAVTPGVDSPVAADVPLRMGEQTYQSQWDVVLAKQPHWVLCDSWNDFVTGNEICASREYGRKYIDATTSLVGRFHGQGAYRTQYLSCNMPKIIPSKTIAQAVLTLRNVGDSPWRVSEGIALAYRWYKDGRFVAESKFRRLLDQDMLPGSTRPITFGVATVAASGEPIPDGDCELRIELIRLSDNKWFTALGDQPLIVPLTIGKPSAWDVTYIACDAPMMVAASTGYPVTVRVRNDGDQVWRKGVVKLGCKLYKVENYTHDNPTELCEQAPMIEARALLAKDCKPGEVASFSLTVTFLQPDKQPVPVWKTTDKWSYQLRFDLYNGKQWLSELGGRTLNRVVDVLDSDWGARLVDSNVPVKLAAGQMFDAKVVLRNNGVYTWDRKRVGIGYHWYHLDGNQMQWDCPRTPIGMDVKPGWPAVFAGKIKAPEYDGQYVLVWDVMADDTWLSTLPITRGGDMLPVFVEVTGGKLVFADIKEMFNVSAISSDSNRSLGDFDGKGSSFPAEHMPPDVGVSQDASSVYPSGYKWDQEVRSDGRISFVYPDKTPGLKNAVACNGQKMIVARDKYLAVHILAASSSGDATGELSINYDDGAVAVPISVSDWGSGPKHDEEVGFAVRHRHSHGGDEAGKYAYLYHYTVPMSASRTATSITLPNNSNVKVVAITLERVSLPSGEASK